MQEHRAERALGVQVRKEQLGVKVMMAHFVVLLLLERRLGAQRVAQIGTHNTRRHGERIAREQLIAFVFIGLAELLRRRRGMRRRMARRSSDVHLEALSEQLRVDGVHQRALLKRHLRDHMHATILTIRIKRGGEHARLADIAECRHVYRCHLDIVCEWLERIQRVVDIEETRRADVDDFALHFVVCLGLAGRRNAENATARFQVAGDRRRARPMRHRRVIVVGVESDEQLGIARPDERRGELGLVQLVDGVGVGGQQRANIATSERERLVVRRHYKYVRHGWCCCLASHSCYSSCCCCSMYWKASKMRTPSRQQ